MEAFKQKSLKSFKIIVFTKNCEILVFERRRLDHQKSYHSQVSQNEFKRIIMAWARATDPARGPRVGDLLQDTETNHSVQNKLCKRVSPETLRRNDAMNIHMLITIMCNSNELIDAGNLFCSYEWVNHLF